MYYSASRRGEGDQISQINGRVIKIGLKEARNEPDDTHEKRKKKPTDTTRVR